LKLNKHLEFFSGTNFDINSDSVSFELKQETEGVFSHNFCFKLDDVPIGRVVSITILNANKSSFEKGWQGYKPFYSYDNINFFRLHDSQYENGILRFELTFEEPSVIIACYPPYYNSNLSAFAESHNIAIEHSEDGFDYFSVGENDLPTYLFFVRQHCGEFQAGYFMEGVVHEHLLSTQNCRLIVIPLVNSGGYKVSNHRLDEAGNDLNRLWNSDNATLRSIIKFSKSINNLRAVFDVHGDEVSKVNYILGSHKIGDGQNSLIFLRPPSFFKRMLINILRNRKILIRKGCQAREYFEKRLKIRSYTIEISAHRTDESICRDLGSKFHKEVAKSRTLR